MMRFIEYWNDPRFFIGLYIGIASTTVLFVAVIPVAFIVEFIKKRWSRP